MCKWTVSKYEPAKCLGDLSSGNLAKSRFSDGWESLGVSPFPSNSHVLPTSPVLAFSRFLLHLASAPRATLFLHILYSHPGHAPFFFQHHQPFIHNFTYQVTFKSLCVRLLSFVTEARKIIALSSCILCARLPLIHIETERPPDPRAHRIDPSTTQNMAYPIPFTQDVPLVEVPLLVTAASSAAASVRHRLHMHQPPRLPLAHSRRCCTGRSISQ